MITKLTFTKNGHETSWANSTDFPAVESNETTVRSDMQLFHTQAQTALNNMIDKLEATTDSASGADQIGATAVGTGSAVTVQGILEELNNRIHNGYPVETTTTNLAWNKEYRLGSITALSITLPAVSDTEACEMRILFHMGSTFAPSITATGATLLGFDSGIFLNGDLVELSIAYIGNVSTTKYIGVVAKRWSIT